jgi:hypothetical protein
MKNYRRIRCYGNYYEPERFQNHGLRGWWIRVLNAVRFWLECKVVFHVLKVDMDKLGDLVDKKKVVDQFTADVEAEKAQQFRESRRPSVPTTGSAEGHLKEIRKPGAVTHPSVLTEQTLKRYAADPRSRRYALGRNSYTIMEAEPTTPQEIAHVPERSQAGESSVSRKEGAGTTVNFVPPKRYARPVHPEYAGSPESENRRIAAEDNPATVAERLSSGARAREDAPEVEKHQRRFVP